MLRARARVYAWWALRPWLYREALRLLTARKLRSSKQRDEASRAESKTWYEEHAVETAMALLMLTGVHHTSEEFEKRFTAELVAARAREIACPIKMGGGANLALLFYLAEYLQATRVIETGVAYGWSSLALLLSLAQRPESLLASTDRPYPGTQSDLWAGCVVPNDLRQRWHIVRRADRDALPRVLQLLPQIDLCHYDSDKSGAGRRWAYPKLWQALRQGGIFVSDDVADNGEFRRFADSVGVMPLIVRTVQPDGDNVVKYVGVLVKETAGSGLAESV